MRTAPPRTHVHPDDPCRNCGDPTRGEFCPGCGQRKVDVQVSVRDLVGDFLEDQFGVDQRTPNTLLALLLRPGFLTREYLDGRIVRYLRPLKLYLVSSLVLFLLVGFVSTRGMASMSFGGGDPTAGFGAAGDSVATQVAQGFRDAMAGVPPAPPPADTPADTSTDALVASPADTVPGAEAEPAADAPTSWLGSVDVNTGSQRLDALVQSRAERLGRMAPEDAVRELVRTFIGYVPTLMFLLLPVFAGLLKLLYFRSPLYYAEHFIFVLHTHAFVFGTFSLAIVAGQAGVNFLPPLLLLWSGLYILLAMRKVYGQSWRKTALKYWTLGWLYFWVLVIALIPTLVLSLVLGG